MEPLPIDEVLPEIRERLARAGNLVIEAPPGAGKTTRVSPALLETVPGQVLVLEPRRIAARMAARRVAAERGERVGGTVGYHVRFESVAGPGTRLHFLTEGVLVRRLAQDRELAGVGAVVLDEFHERHLETDFALALLRRLQQTRRRDLLLLVMSATLEAAPVAEFLGACPVVRSQGRSFPLEIRYTPHSAAPLEEQVAGALEDLIREGLDGDVLVFLPGAAEIRRAERLCAPIARRAGAELCRLHGDLPAEEQDRAVSLGSRPKVILSTNVAESSITVPGVTAVIDSGLARIAADSPWTGLPSLRIARISQASARQRAGRAGRLRPGRVVRLYPEADYVRRPPHEPPEILRRELSPLFLQLHAAGLGRPDEIEWLDAPPAEAVQHAESLLRQLGALDAGGGLTALGRAMVRMPVHPRLARMAIEAARRGAAGTGCAAAAVLSEGLRLPETVQAAGPSDVLVLAEGSLPARVRRLARQIERALPRGSQNRAADSDEALLVAVLSAFPDRVARRRSGNELLLASGGSAVLSDRSVVRDARLLVAVEIEERRERGLPLVRLASAIEAEWLLDLLPERIAERSGLVWNREAERVEAASALLFGEIVIEESRRAPDPEEAARMLAEKALAAGLGRFADLDAVEAFRNRVRFAAAHGPVREITEEDLRDALEELCQGLRSFRELAAAAANGGFLELLRSRIPPEERRIVEELAPERIRLPGGRRLRIHYEPGKPPWAAVRIQELFGMKETPRVAAGRVPLTLHLLAPNMRPVQTTTDLAGFWERLYPSVRRELRRRYPKHAWPEDPLTARPQRR